MIKTTTSKEMGPAEPIFHGALMTLSLHHKQLTCSAFIQGADHRKHQSSALLAFVRGIHRSPVNSPHKGPATRKMFPFDDVIMSEDSLAVQLPSASSVKPSSQLQA